MMFLRDYVFHPLVNARILPRRFLPLQYCRRRCSSP